MAYLYNLYAGSLDDLRARMAAIDLEDPEAVKEAVRTHDPVFYDDLALDEEEVEDGAAGPLVLSALVEASWSPSPGELMNWLDWHDEDELLEQARPRLSPEGHDLLGWLFQAAPLDVTPLDWGFRGSLTHLEVARLRDELVAVLPPAAVESARVGGNGHDWQGSGESVGVPLAWVLVSLERVPEGRDVALRLG